MYVKVCIHNIFSANNLIMKYMHFLVSNKATNGLLGGIEVSYTQVHSYNIAVAIIFVVVYFIAVLYNMCQYIT